ncbi:hypothetical protein HQ590_16660, partial [bacterium]|nr:hypothetical protein [bacterium]
MHWIDWTIVGFTMLIVLFIGFRTQRFVKSVADFLTAGRVAGRYVMCVSTGEAGMGLITLVAVYESYYQSGFAYGFWNSLAAPVFIVLGLTGYCVYRFRETRAMTMGQFLEIRYSRKFRLFAGILQSISGIINYGLFPAVGARFVVYFCGLPVETVIGGLVFPTFGLVMAVFLGLAVMISTMGGQITIIVTDCVQGLLSYPMYAVVVGFILLNFSWFNDLVPSILDRQPGQSMINPFDITRLRDFNLLYVFVGILGNVINRLGWSGAQGYNTCARNAHEQKLSGVLGSWRAGFAGMMYLLLAVVAFAYLNSDKYQAGPRGAVACRTELAVKAVNDVVAGDHLADTRAEVIAYLNTGTVTPELQVMLDKTAAMKATEEAERAKMRYRRGDEPAPAAADSEPAAAAPAQDDPVQRQQAREARFQTAREAIQAVDPGASQTYATIFGQMRVPIALRYLLPIGVTGLFCAICIFLMITTDTTYLHSWGCILIQDVVLPFRSKPFTPKQQLTVLRLAIAGVAVFAFFFSYFFGQVDYILMFFAITGAIWLGGSGPCIVGGLYWKRGTSAGAMTALLLGALMSVAGIVCVQVWPAVYGEEFMINGQWIFFFTIVAGSAAYILVSLLGRKTYSFNLDRLLHRGAYAVEEDRAHTSGKTSPFMKLFGITKEFTRFDRITAYIVIGWFIMLFVVFVAGSAYCLLVETSEDSWAVFWYWYLWQMFIVFT